MHNNVVILDGVELSDIFPDVLSLDSKHPIKDIFNEVNFLADVDRFVCKL